VSRVERRRDEWVCRLERDAGGAVDAVEIERRNPTATSRSLRLDGPQLTPVLEPLVALLQRSGVDGRQLTGSGAFTLADPPGPQVELLIDAVRPVRRYDRVRGIAHGVAEMSTEEATYWHARAHRPGGLPALRTLLAGGRR
jgi:hypothetical protein